MSPIERCKNYIPYRPVCRKICNKSWESRHIWEDNIRMHLTGRGLVFGFIWLRPAPRPTEPSIQWLPGGNAAGASS
jgi:hypothetical protein